MTPQRASRSHLAVPLAQASPRDHASSPSVTTHINRDDDADGSHDCFGGSFALSHGIILRSLRPVTSTGWLLSAS